MPTQKTPGVAGDEGHDLAAVLDRRARRLLDHDVQVGLQRVAQHVDVGVVGRGDDQRVDRRLGQQRPVVLVRLDVAAQQRVGGVARRPVRVGDGRHPRALGQADIADVLLAHHAAANDAHAQFRAHVALPGRWCLCGRTAATRYLAHTTAPVVQKVSRRRPAQARPGRSAPGSGERAARRRCCRPPGAQAPAARPRRPAPPRRRCGRS